MIRVLIVEDSPTFRLLMRALLSADPELKVVGQASNGEEALSLVESLRPDLITMDVTMPVMNGFEATRAIMASWPTPIIVVSTLTDLAESMDSFQAIQAGALEVLPKPVALNHPDFSLHRERLVQTVKRLAQLRLQARSWEPEARARPLALQPKSVGSPASAQETATLHMGEPAGGGGAPSKASPVASPLHPPLAPAESWMASSRSALSLPRVSPVKAPALTGSGLWERSSMGASVSALATQSLTSVPSTASASGGPVVSPAASQRVAPPRQLVAIGSSTGGPAALKTLLKTLPATFPLPLVAVQHITEGYLTSFIQWLQQECAIRLKVAAEGDLLLPGTLYFAPDSLHLEVGPGGLCHLSSAPPVSFVRPAVTVLFESVARAYGSGAVGILLTGMGDDGAKGLLSMRRQGAHTVVQDESTCIVYGMPRVAVELGAAELILPLDRIGPHLIRTVEGES